MSNLIKNCLVPVRAVSAILNDREDTGDNCAGTSLVEFVQIVTQNKLFEKQILLVSERGTVDALRMQILIRIGIWHYLRASEPTTAIPVTPTRTPPGSLPFSRKAND